MRATKDRTTGGYLKQGSDVDVVAQIGEAGGDHLGAAVVAVLAHLGDQDARPSALHRHKLVNLSADHVELLLVGELGLVRARDHRVVGHVATEHLYIQNAQYTALLRNGRFLWRSSFTNT